LGTNVAALAVPQANRVATNPTSYIAQTEDIQSIAENLVQLLAEDNYEEAENLFGSPIKDEVSPESLQNHKANFIAWHGEFQQILGTRTPEENLVVVEVETTQKTTDVFVIFNENREVVGVDYLQEAAE
jgi:3-deoxy-D-arabino-heptulosonate 7-phosphate (DAHP) synthase